MTATKSKPERFALRVTNIEFGPISDRCQRAGKRVPASDRFFQKVRKDDSGCWEWTGSKLPAGYGRFSYGGDGNMGLAHRWSWEFHRGPIPAGMAIDHLCRNTSCVNPDHLEVVTYRENNIRSLPYKDGSTDMGCKHGHPWTEANTYWHPKGHRNCRACRNAGNAAYNAKRRKK